MRRDSPPPSWYEPRDEPEDGEEPACYADPDDELVIHGGVCSWHAVLTHDDD